VIRKFVISLVAAALFTAPAFAPAAVFKLAPQF
jgi:hypothetical protein